MTQDGGRCKNPLRQLIQQINACKHLIHGVSLSTYKNIINLARPARKEGHGSEIPGARISQVNNQVRGWLLLALIFGKNSRLNRS